jgi:hypothetical protein
VQNFRIQAKHAHKPQLPWLHHALRDPPTPQYHFLLPSCQQTTAAMPGRRFDILRTSPLGWWLIVFRWNSCVLTFRWTLISVIVAQTRTSIILNWREWTFRAGAQSVPVSGPSILHQDPP